VERVDGGTARIVGAGFEPLAVPADGLDRGAEVTIGVRPEHLRIAGQGPFATSGAVELVERLGESSFAHVRRTDDKMLVVEVRGRETPGVTATVTFRAPLQDIHVFDASGQRIDTSKGR
jgi:ABC-type sugar transport system ATPase subunit